MSFGKGLNAWRDEWEANEELRFQFPLWNDYAYRCLRKVWDDAPHIQRLYRDGYTAFTSAAKKDASDVLLAAREKASRDEAKQQAADTSRRGSGLRRFVDTLVNHRRSSDERDADKANRRN